MTTINQQIDFMHELRDSFDSNQRERIATNRSPEQVAELLRDIEENLHAVRFWQVAQKVELCIDCNQPITSKNKVAIGVTENSIVVHPGESVCIRCTTIRAQKSISL